MPSSTGMWCEDVTRIESYLSVHSADENDVFTGWDPGNFTSVAVDGRHCGVINIIGN